MNIQFPLLLSALLLILCACANPALKQDSSCADALRSPSGKWAVEPPPPVVVVGGNFFYADESNSVIDEELYKRNEEARKPLRNYLDQIIKMTEASQKGDLGAGAVIDSWLGAWADGKAMTQVNSQQGGFERKWILSGLLISYWRNSPHIGWKNTQKIEKWLNDLTHLMREDYLEYKKGSQKNNHVYWAGLVAIEMATINGDKTLMNWGLEKIRFGLSQIDKEGFLPLELERKGRALQYHRVSIEALMMAAYFAKLQGIDILSENNSALNRLALTTLKGYQDPQVFATKTGVKQEFKIKDSTALLAIYNTLRPGNQEVLKLLTEFPPVANRALGGMVSNIVEKSSVNSCARAFN